MRIDVTTEFQVVATGDEQQPQIGYCEVVGGLLRRSESVPGLHAKLLEMLDMVTEQASVRQRIHINIWTSE